MMTEKEFKKIETAIYNMVGDDGMFAGDVAEKQKLSATMLKSLIKRSSKLEYRGHRVERLKER
jgi:predicted DNA-binding ArsR family transcriptional regulator